MRKVRENLVASFGNQSVFAADTAVFLSDTNGTGNNLNGILAGQMVIYDYATGVSVGPGVTPSTVEKLVIAVGVDTNSDGLADFLQAPFGDKIYGCNISDAKAKAPVCGVVDIVDVAMKCGECSTDYTININVEDDITQNQYPYNRPATYTYTVKSDCCDCESCEDDASEAEIWCLLADKINGKVGSTDPRVQSVFPKLGLKSPDIPFYAYPLFANDTTYCFSPVATACETCNHINSIAAVTIDGTQYAFTNTIDPANPTLSLQAQMPRIVALINDAFQQESDGGGNFGHAVWTKAVDGSGCCDYQLRINSCGVVTLQDHADVNIATCASGSPFTAFTSEAACKGCGTGDSYTPTAGLRIVAKPVNVDCNCDTPPDTPRGWLSRSISVDAGERGGGFECGAFYKNDVQTATIPQNLGYEWQNRAADQDMGGRGRNYNPWGMDPHGRWGNPLKGSRGTESARNVKCNENYCSYSIEHTLPNSDTGVHGRMTAARGRTVVLIPSGDATTISEFEAILNPYLAGSDCPTKASITCGEQGVDIIVE